MTTYLFPPAPVPSLPIRGEARRFPVGRIFCVGRNYHAHAVEMGRPVDKAAERAFYFTKTPSALVESGATVAYPPETTNYHFEMELVLAIGRPGFRVKAADAHTLVYGYAAGLDMTRRDLQGRMKDGGRPWEIGKAFEQSAPMAAIYPVSAVGHPENAEIWLQVNGVEKQRGNINDLIWPVADVISYLSRFFTLQPGDLIMTGTPEGVGPVIAGDALRCHIDGLGELQVHII